MDYFTLMKSHKLIKGLQAHYSPKYYFVWQGKIYPRMKTATAINRGFHYPFVDFVDLREYIKD